MQRQILFLILWLLFFGSSRLSRAQATWPPSLLPKNDALAKLIAESLSSRPEIESAREEIDAQTARSDQEGSIPDPNLQLGIQNDGFTSIEIGKMQQSWFSVMLSQTFPWPGKPSTRKEVGLLEAEVKKFALYRVKLSIEAEVRRLYVALLLTRDKIVLTDDLLRIWKNTFETVRSMYETGGGSQADMFRAKLELSRLKQKKIDLVLEEQTALQAINRLRSRPLSEPIESTTNLVDFWKPSSFDETWALNDALSRSPELHALYIQSMAAEKGMSLAHKNYFPDLTVNLGIMFRGSEFPPMWQFSISGPVPIFAAGKQSREVDEYRARLKSSQANLVAMKELISLRVRQRKVALLSLMENLTICDSGLLIESRATAESMLWQYRSGKGSFTGLLDSNAGVFLDTERCLTTLADANAVVISGFEVNLASISTPIEAKGALMISGGEGKTSVSSRAGSPGNVASGGM